MPVLRWGEKTAKTLNTIITIYAVELLKWYFF